MEPGKPKMKAWEDLVSSEHTFPGLQTAVYLREKKELGEEKGEERWREGEGEGKKKVLKSLLIRALTPFVRAPSS